MKKEWLIKTLSPGIVILFIGIAVLPSFYAESVKPLKPEINPFKNKSVDFEVIEFKPDGTIEKTIVELTLEEAKEFGRKIKDLKTAEEQLSLYKEYGFIPEEMTLEKLRLGMEEQAERNSLTDEKLIQFIENKSSSFFKSNFIRVNLKCYVSGENFGPLRFIIGLSSITRIINNFLFITIFPIIQIPSVDLLNTQIGLLWQISAKEGILDDTYFEFFLGVYEMLGFVGYYINILPFFYLINLLPIFTLWDSWIGYSTIMIMFGKEIV